MSNVVNFYQWRIEHELEPNKADIFDMTNAVSFFDLIDDHKPLPVYNRLQSEALMTYAEWCMAASMFWLEQSEITRRKAEKLVRVYDFTQTDD